MANIPLPTKIDFVNEQGNSASLVIEPLYPGFGTTVGNLLRRMLLSSLSGVAISKIKISGVDHEFTTMPYVKEDVVQIVLNLKQIRLRANNQITEPVKLKINVSGEQDVTAGDLEAPSDVEVINPKHKIATITDKAGKFEAEFTVTAGRGYVAADQQEEEDKEVGVMAVDAIYSPVQKVGLEIHNVRVDKMTNYDSLTLEIETDGTRDPQSAVKEAIEIVRDHLDVIYSGGQQQEVASKASESEAGGGDEGDEEVE